jgi:amino acid transporter
VICVYLTSNVALIRFYHKYHPEEVTTLQHKILPVVTFIFLLFPLVGNFYTQNFKPYNYFVYLIIAWISLGVILMLGMKKWYPGSLEKIGHAFNNKN